MVLYEKGSCCFSFCIGEIVSTMMFFSSGIGGFGSQPQCTMHGNGQYIDWERIHYGLNDFFVTNNVPNIDLGG